MTTYFLSPVDVASEEFLKRSEIPLVRLDPKAYLYRHLVSLIEEMIAMTEDESTDGLRISVKYKDASGSYATIKYPYESISNGLIVPFNFVGVYGVTIEFEQEGNNNLEVILSS